jgi:tetratricopeptide (TPR) repeat protein
MKILSILFMCALLLTGMACKQQKETSATGIVIPELRNRPHVIGPEDEMGAMMDMYNKLAANVKANPADHASRLGIAELFMQEARISGDHGYYYPAAMELIENVLEENPVADLQFRALLDLGSVQLSQHNFEEAKSSGEKALALNPHTADVYGILVDAHVELGDYAKAIEYADKMASVRPDIRSYSRISYLREIHGHVDEAIEAMKLAVTAGYPGMEQTEWARLALGSLYERYGMPDSAMIQYQQALAYRPNYPFAIGAMAAVHAAKGEQAKADSLNAVAMGLIPEISFYVQQAEWEKEDKAEAKAKELTGEIMQMLADDVESGHKMSLEYAHVYFTLLEDADKALAAVAEDYTIRPENIDVNRMMAELYLYKGDLDKAAMHLDKAQRTGSKDPHIKVLEGMLMVKTDRLAEGKAIIKSAFVKNPHLSCTFCAEAKSKML